MGWCIWCHLFSRHIFLNEKFLSSKFSRKFRAIGGALYPIWRGGWWRPTFQRFGSAKFLQVCHERKFNSKKRGPFQKEDLPKALNFAGATWSSIFVMGVFPAILKQFSTGANPNEEDAMPEVNAYNEVVGCFFFEEKKVGWRHFWRQGSWNCLVFGPDQSWCKCMGNFWGISLIIVHPCLGW